MREVLNAKDISLEVVRQQLLLIGPSGSGKTTAFRTLLGKKFLYIFDPNGLDAIKGSDIDYAEFTPEMSDLDIAVKALAKGKQDLTARERAPIPKTYLEWEKDWFERFDSGFFDKYDWIGFDSFTSFQDIIMDRVLFLSGRLGKHPEQPDWTAEMNTSRMIFRAAASCTNICLMAHTEMVKDGLTGAIHGQIVMTGKNRVRIPLLFSQIFVTKASTGTQGQRSYIARSVPERENPVARTSIRGLDPEIDVIVDFNKPIEGQGLGGIIKELM